MTLLEFKQLFGIQTLKFYHSKQEGSTRSVAAFGNNQLLVTTKNFDPSSPSKFVYPNPMDESGYILSNKEQREADFVL